MFVETNMNQLISDKLNNGIYISEFLVGQMTTFEDGKWLGLDSGHIDMTMRLI